MRSPAPLPMRITMLYHLFRHTHAHARQDGDEVPA